MLSNCTHGSLYDFFKVPLNVKFSGNTQNFAEPWKNTQTDASLIAVCFYSGIFSYAGWNYLNFMTEELKDPYKSVVSFL